MTASVQENKPQTHKRLNMNGFFLIWTKRNNVLPSRKRHTGHTAKQPDNDDDLSQCNVRGSCSEESAVTRGDRHDKLSSLTGCISVCPFLLLLSGLTSMPWVWYRNLLLCRALPLWCIDVVLSASCHNPCCRWSVDFKAGREFVVSGMHCTAYNKQADFNTFHL